MRGTRKQNAAETLTGCGCGLSGCGCCIMLVGLFLTGILVVMAGGM